MNKVNQLTISSRRVVSAIALVAIAGCGGNAASPPGAVTVVPPSSAKLQLAIGTADISGDSTGLNVVTTLRTPAGKSVLVNTPTLTGPFVLPATPGVANANGSTITTGPSAAEIAAGGLISASPQVAAGGTPAVSTFGNDGGVFAGGFQPANADNRGATLSANGDNPYPQPNYDSCAPAVPSSGASFNPDCAAGGTDYMSATVNMDTFLPIGGPPAFDPNNDGEGTRDGTFDSSVLGVNEGINVFAGVSVPAGQYNESTLIPSNGTTQTTVSAAPVSYASAPPLLPVPTAPTYMPDGSGGGYFVVGTLPAGVTDALIDVVDYGPDYGQYLAGTITSQPINCYTNGSYPAYFTIHTTPQLLAAATPTGTAALPDLDGVGSPTVHNPTICTAAENTAANGGTATDGDSYEVFLIGADYPIYASNVLFTLNTQLPTLTASPGASTDITISALGGSSDLLATARARAHHSRAIIRSNDVGHTVFGSTSIRR
jgi:hypothetical protein